MKLNTLSMVFCFIKRLFWCINIIIIRTTNFIRVIIIIFVDPCGQLVCRTNVCIFFTAQINPGRLNRFECKSLNLWLGLGSVIACYVMLVWYVPHLVGKMLSDIMSMKWFKFLITATLLMYEILFWWVLIISFVFDSKNSVIII